MTKNDTLYMKNSMTLNKRGKTGRLGDNTKFLQYSEI